MKIKPVLLGLMVGLLLLSGCSGTSSENPSIKEPSSFSGDSLTGSQQESNEFPLVVTPLDREALQACITAYASGEMSLYIDPQLLNILRGMPGRYTCKTEVYTVPVWIITAFDGSIYTQTVRMELPAGSGSETVESTRRYAQLGGQPDSSGMTMDLFVYDCLDDAEASPSYVGTCWSAQMLSSMG